MKKSIVMILVVLQVLLLTACGGSKEATTATTPAKEEVKVKGKIGVMQHNQADSFQQAMLKGAQETAAALGYDIVDASSNDDPVKELEIIRNFAKQEVTLLVLGSTTQAAGEAGIELAHELGMKVVTMDSIHSKTKADAQVGGDDVAAGYFAGKALAESMGGSGKVAISKFPEPIPPSEDRVEGFYKAFKEYPNIEVVADAGTGFDTIKAMNWAAAIIQANPDIKGFISIEDTSASGIVRAVENAKLEDQIGVVTVVESQGIYKELEKGTVVEGVFAMHSYNYGAISVFMLDRLNNNRPAPFIIKTTGVLVDQSNVKENMEYLNFN